MANLLAPKVLSGPSVRVGGFLEKTNIDDLTFPQLQIAKDNLESEIRALGSVLKSHDVDMKTPLLTPDGYPRVDLDVALIRSTRARINFLLGDLKELMVVIEKRIHTHFTNLGASNGLNNEVTDLNGKDSCPTTTPTSVISIPNSSSFDSLKLSPPFAKVNSIVDKSPAESAGLWVGDLIRNFGYVNISNHNSLKRIIECLQGNEERIIHVKVSRPLNSYDVQELDLKLKPSRGWGGSGLVGCHILPY